MNHYGRHQDQWDEPLEQWESLASREDRNAWRGEVHAESVIAVPLITDAAERSKGIDALRQLSQMAAVQTTQMLIMRQLAQRVELLSRELYDLQTWKAQREERDASQHAAMLAFDAELAELAAEEPSVTTLAPDFSVDLMLDDWA